MSSLYTWLNILFRLTISRCGTFQVLPTKFTPKSQWLWIVYWQSSWIFPPMNCVVKFASVMPVESHLLEKTASHTIFVLHSSNMGHFNDSSFFGKKIFHDLMSFIKFYQQIFLLGLNLWLNMGSSQHCSISCISN